MKLKEVKENPFNKLYKKELLRALLFHFVTISTPFCFVGSQQKQSFPGAEKVSSFISFFIKRKVRLPRQKKGKEVSSFLIDKKDQTETLLTLPQKLLGEQQQIIRSMTLTSSPAAYLAKNNLSSVMPTTTEQNQLAKKFYTYKRRRPERDQLKRSSRYLLMSGSPPFQSFTTIFLLQIAALEVLF